MGLRVLVTNDDGIDSPGLVALAQCACDLGWTTIVAAPATESSGTSAGLIAATNERRITVERRTLPDLPDVEAYAVAAYPAVIALAACNDGFGAKPDLVLSGINRGGNVGRAILHSGTVGAALTGAVNGARALAVSLDLPLDADGDPAWDRAKQITRLLLPMAADLEPGAVLNVNIPDVAEPKPARWARLASFGRVQSKLTQLDKGSFEVGAVEVEGELEPDTDAALIEQGYVTVTALRSVHEDDSLMGGALPS